MAFTLVVYFRDTRTARVAGCTSLVPSEVNATVNDGYYRDQFTGNSSADLFFPGTEVGGGGSVAESQPVPAFIQGGIVPSGPVTIEELANDVSSHVTISQFNVAVSDEIAHAALRQVSYQESYWSFPISKDGVAGFAYFKKSVVDGWGPEPDDDQ